MIRYEVEVEGLTRLQTQFQKAPQLTMPRLKDAMGKSLARLQATAKDLAPVDTGTLRGSIIPKPMIISGSTITCSVGTGLDYSLHMEQGTGIYGPRRTPIRPKNKKVLAWKQGGAWRFAKEVKGVRPRWYMRGSLERNTDAINRYFATAADEVARELGGGGS